MHLDISRDSFDPTQHFLRVLQHQGGVLLDTDANEQAAILLYRLQNLALDLFGPSWGPAAVPTAFQIGFTGGNADLTIEPGRYYVGGRQVENDGQAHYLSQPHVPAGVFIAKDLATFPLGVYLDVWERHVTELEVAIKDPGLEQLGSSTRTQLVWQVRVTTKLPAPTGATPADKLTGLIDSLTKLLKPPVVTNLGTLRAGPIHIPGVPPTAGMKPCPTPAAAGYAGLENQLYRVEVHRGGPAFTIGSDPKTIKDCATFKWSRDNGSLIYSIADFAWSGDDLTVTLKSAGLDDYSRLGVGDWVEYLDDTVTLGYNALDPGAVVPLLQVTHVDPLDPALLVLTAKPAGKAGVPTAAGGNAFLRGWNQQPAAEPPATVPSEDVPMQSVADNALLVVAADAGKPESGWFNLENGVQVSFADGTYQRGDYWLIPARFATGAVLWPVDDKNQPKALAPRGTKHAYAPLQVFLDVSHFLDSRKVLDQAKLDALFIKPAPVV